MSTPLTRRGTSGSDDSRGGACGRAGYIAGLRRLADLLEQDPAMPLPYFGESPYNLGSVYVYDRAGVAAYAAVLEDPHEEIDPNAQDYGYKLTGHLAGLRLRITATVEVACRATVTGTETVQTVNWRTPLGVVRAGYRRPESPESVEPSTDPADLQRLPETDPGCESR